MNILVINAGSSSLKYQLLNPETGDPIVSDQLVPIRLPKMETVYMQGDEVIDREEYETAKAEAAAGTQEDVAQFEAEYSVSYQIRYPEVAVDDEGNAGRLTDYQAKKLRQMVKDFPKVCRGGSE